MQVGDLLRETSASPELRAALFKVAAGIPGVKLLGTVTDSDGRSGTAIAFPHPARGDEENTAGGSVPASEASATPSPAPAGSDAESPAPTASGDGSPAPSDSPSPSPSSSPPEIPGRVRFARTVLNELIFDPDTSGLLAEQTVLVRPDGSTKLLLWSDYLLSGVVTRSATSRPQLGALAEPAAWPGPDPGRATLAI